MNGAVAAPATRRQIARATEFSLLLTLLGLVSWRMIQVFPPEGRLNSDAQWSYLPNAYRFLEAPWSFLTTDAYSSQVAPLAYLWPALWGADQFATQCANSALFLIALLMLWWGVRRLGGALAGLTTVALFLVHPELVKYAPQVLTESLYLFGFALALMAAVWALGGHHMGLWLGLMALGLCITLLTRPVLLYVTILVWAGCLLVWALKRPARFKLPARALALSLSAAMLLPLAVIAKNGVVFGVWGMSTSAGAGLYYGTSPFKNGAEPTYSNFHYDINAAPDAVDPQHRGALSSSSDQISARVALGIIRGTDASDNLRFFARKFRMWMLTATPELYIDPYIRTLQVFEWLCIGGFVLLAVSRRRHIRAAVWPQPGPSFTSRQKLAIYVALMVLLLAMAVQLTPVLYNSRYASYFIQPWLAVLVGLSVGYAMSAISATKVLAGLIVLALFAWLADASTRYALRNEAWAINPHRPGPTALLMPASDMGPTQGDGMVPVGPNEWLFTTQPATLRIAVRAPPTLDGPRLDAMWRMRFGLAVAGKPHASCAKAQLHVEPHHADIDWYTAPAQLFVERDGQPHDYMVAANGPSRPKGQASVSLTFHCPAGSRLTWIGMELRASTIGQAAREFVKNGMPINPYLKEPLTSSP